MLSSQYIAKCVHNVTVRAGSVNLMNTVENVTYGSALGLNYELYFSKQFQIYSVSPNI
jgi:hypothetical protein